MLRKVIAASLVLVLSVGVVFADEIRAVITKVEGNKITFAKIEGKGKDAKKGEEQTMTAIKDVKVVRAKKGEEPVALEGGLKHKMFADISEKGVRAMIVTDGDNKKITEIRIFGGKKKQ